MLACESRTASFASWTNISHEPFALGELGQDPLDDEDLLEALDAEALGLEDLGHAAVAETLEQAVAAKGLVHGGIRRSGFFPPKGLKRKANHSIEALRPAIADPTRVQGATHGRYLVLR